MSKVAMPSLSSRVDPEVKRAFSLLVDLLDGIISGSTPVGSATELVAASDTVISSLTGTISPVANVQVVGAFNTILISWTDNQSRALIAGYEIFRATVDDLGAAVNIGYTTARGYADTPSDSSTAVEYFYWVRPVVIGGTFGPFNGLAGTSGTTANDPTYFHELLQGQILSGDLPEVLKEVFFQTSKFAIINPDTPALTVTSITRSGTTATATTSTAHGFLSGTYRILAGATQPEYNGMKLITATGTYTFTFQVVSSVATPATVAPGISSIKVTGAAATVPFIVQGGVVYIDAAMIADATITNAMIANLTADKILSGTLTAGQAIRVAAGGSIAGSDYCEITEGDITFYAYLNGDHRPYKSLKRFEAGSITTNSNGNATITIPGYFRSAPTVRLFPESIGIFNTTYWNQSQKLNLKVDNVYETYVGSKMWLADITAGLALSSASTPGPTTDYTDSNDIYYNANIDPGYPLYDTGATTYVGTAPANTQSITMSGTVRVEVANYVSGFTDIYYWYVLFEIQINGVWQTLYQTPSTFYTHGRYDQSWAFNITKTIAAGQTVNFRCRLYLGGCTQNDVYMTKYIYNTACTWNLSSSNIATAGTVNWTAMGGDV